MFLSLPLDETHWKVGELHIRNVVPRRTAWNIPKNVTFQQHVIGLTLA